jgi:hypothetical protein
MGATREGADRICANRHRPCIDPQSFDQHPMTDTSGTLADQVLWNDRTKTNIVVPCWG